MWPSNLLLSIAFLRTLRTFRGALAAPIHDKVDEIDNIHFDFIIVGGGTAGNVVANRLTENPNFSVLVIEAGPSHEDILNSEVPFFAINNWFTQYDWNYTTVPQPGLGGKSAIIPRGHVLGGSSSINFLMYTRSTREDYDRIARITGDQGWSWNSLFPYFKKNEKFVLPADRHNITGQFTPSVHGFKGPLAVSLPGFETPIDSKVVTATQQLGGGFSYVEDYNNGKPLGVGFLQVTMDENGRRASSATAYLAPRYLKRPNLHVLVNAQVSRLIQTSRGKTPSFLTVEFRHRSRKRLVQLTAKKEVILSAGAIGSPHIMLNSGIGDAEALKAIGIKPLVDLPDVGQNLADHSAIANPFVALGNDTFERIRQPNVTAQLLKEWKKSGTGPLVNTVAISLIQKNGLIVPNAFVPPGQPIFSVATAIVSPSSIGSLTINSTDPFAMPLIDLALLKEDSDRRMMRAALRHAFKFLTAPVWDDYVRGGAGDLAGATTDEQLDEYINAEAGTFFHPTGTAFMSPKGSKKGVLDPDLRVKKISGLRVVDASVFVSA
ncbi:hypothetical protein NLJ89_g5775 [Agrocybe chaxingu]|uniref:pyranose dehydrogenase (acceptor) n=1 Tax=Agrocybe chaxingu TaxID=84603 RepID=A0A9W8K056_9AGAR|nr:hypothetical protein NLJ89_g5775 [Agrocybe chaxingu]